MLSRIHNFVFGPNFGIDRDNLFVQPNSDWGTVLPPATGYIITETSDFIITETGDRMITE